MPSRGNRNAASANQDYEIILPTPPTGRIVLNTVFFHADVRGRPYRVEDIRDALGTLAMLPDVEALGAFQMNHVWAVTLKTTEAKNRLLSATEVTVKERRCLIVDRNNQDVRLKLHSVLHYVDDEDIRTAFAPYGKVTEVARERWRTEGLSDKGSTTRIIRLQLKAGYTKEDIPHQLRVAGDLTLVVVAGRAPLCLRCKGTGHIRRECRVPRCALCRRFRHAEEECVKTYAKVTGRSAWDDNAELQMDESEPEDVSTSKTKEPEQEETPSSSHSPNVNKEKEDNAEQVVQPALPPATKTSTSNSSGKKTIKSQSTPLEKSEDVDIKDFKTGAGKRTREETPAANAASNEPTAGEPPPKAAQGRRTSFKPKPNVPLDRHIPGGT
ncbi:uncharacterized protein [Dermacentor andersoni]|uniref:uncharacterized protein n=1 Tax=Dermacentor andersoni TaxID=34620 RepID=UPI00215540F7|nr:uncharacterized protein LOC126526584 [Dermacentor andersoni]